MFLHHGRLATSDVACCCTVSVESRLQNGLVLTCCSRIDAESGCDVSDVVVSDDVVLPRAQRSDSERKILARDSFFTAETHTKKRVMLTGSNCKINRNVNYAQIAETKIFFFVACSNCKVRLLPGS